MNYLVLSSILTMAASAAPTDVTYENYVFMPDVTSPRVDDTAQMCFYFVTDEGLEGFYYALSGPWGDAEGHAGNNGTICDPTSDKAGGAMYISGASQEAAGPGSTKLECFFPESGEANCDVSLVDGYSNSVACFNSDNSAQVGGLDNFWSTGVACPDVRGTNCINTEGYAASQSDVNAFFQQGVKDYNEYCIWHYCSQDYSFPTGAGINCVVTKAH